MRTRPMRDRWPTLVLWTLVAAAWALLVMSAFEARSVTSSLCAMDLAKTAEGCR